MKSGVLKSVQILTRAGIVSPYSKEYSENHGITLDDVDKQLSEKLAGSGK